MEIFYKKPDNISKIFEKYKISVSEQRTKLLENYHQSIAKKSNQSQKLANKLRLKFMHDVLSDLEHTKEERLLKIKIEQELKDWYKE